MAHAYTRLAPISAQTVSGGCPTHARPCACATLQKNGILRLLQQSDGQPRQRVLYRFDHRKEPTDAL